MNAFVGTSKGQDDEEKQKKKEKNKERKKLKNTVTQHVLKGTKRQSLVQAG